ADGALDLRASLELSYNRLGATAARLLQQLGQGDGAESSRVVVGPGLDQAQTEHEDALEQLVDYHFLQVVGQDSAGRVKYQLPDLQRIYARSITQLAQQ